MLPSLQVKKAFSIRNTRRKLKPQTNTLIADNLSIFSTPIVSTPMGITQIIIEQPKRPKGKPRKALNSDDVKETNNILYFY